MFWSSVRSRGRLDGQSWAASRQNLAESERGARSFFRGQDSQSVTHTKSQARDIASSRGDDYIRAPRKGGSMKTSKKFLLLLAIGVFLPLPAFAHHAMGGETPQTLVQGLLSCLLYTSPSPRD